MPNKINVPKFLDILRISTLNYSINNVSMTFDSDNITIGMRGDNTILLVNKENDVIEGISEQDEWQFNFSEPSKNTKLYFDLINPDEQDMVNIKMLNEKIVIEDGSQKSQLFFCSERVVTKFTGDGPKTTGESVCTMNIDDEFIDKYNTVKRVAGSFGKIYFVVEDGILFIEATDKTNVFSNGIKIELGKANFSNVDICCDFKSLNNIMTLISDSEIDFIFNIGYIEKSKGGIMSFIGEEMKERYYLLSIRE